MGSGNRPDQGVRVAPVAAIRRTVATPRQQARPERGRLEGAAFDSGRRVAGTAVLIECHDAETAAAIATHRETAALCLRAGDRQLVVRLEHEEKFRGLVRMLGFGMTTA